MRPISGTESGSFRDCVPGVPLANISVKTMSDSLARTFFGFLLLSALGVSAEDHTLSTLEGHPRRVVNEVSEQSAEAYSIAPLYFSTDVAVRTAYQSRSRIIEDRPMLMSLTRFGTEAGPLGKVGIWMWDVSSLSLRRRHVHRGPLSEIDGGPSWWHTWDFAQYGDQWKGWSLTTEFVKNWITLHGYEDRYRQKKSDASISEWRFGQILKNPYLTPAYLIRVGVHPDPWYYTRLSLLKPIPVWERLTLTPQFQMELGNRRLFELRYGDRPDGGEYRDGVMTGSFLLELSWAYSKNLTFYTSVHQFGLLADEARDSIKARKTTEARRDLTIGAVGVRCKF